ncbi:3'-5' exonuclease [Marinobacterium litorale]|uniref:3'-5' exonuclease n=1 Tax=Marinobacterium litorale TaxID=404770 RepID=UPI000428884F|nr:exonuclease domain-containing protein [Marinobacterium litorale]
MRSRQQLIGIWLLLAGACLFIPLGLIAWLETRNTLDGPSRIVVWCLAFLPGALVLCGGALLERKLLAPLRQLQVLLARLIASPDARGDFPLSGWLINLEPDLDRIRSGWREDRARIEHAHQEGAGKAAFIQEELESVVQELATPLLICDRHQRLLLFNPAAQNVFAENPALGLGRSISQLIPHSSLGETLRQLPDNGSPRQLLLPGRSRWYRCDLRRLGARHGGALITLHDTTHELSAEQSWRRSLATLVPRMRGHLGSLNSAAQLLEQATDDPQILDRLHGAIIEEGDALARELDGLTRVIESQQLSQARLEETWSNDLLAALSERLADQQISITPVGIPVWLKVDAPAVLSMLSVLIRLLQQEVSINALDIEPLLGNRRVYLDLTWHGEPISHARIQQWETTALFDDPFSPRISDVLSQHGAELWSRAGARRGLACLRLPLPASERGLEPATPALTTDRDARPEFHDFSIAELPPPDSQLQKIPLTQLEMVVFDTETTGLELRKGDRVISLAACRIVNGRLLAQDYYDQLVNPERPIPPQSTRIHGLCDDDVNQAPPVAVVLPRFREYVGRGVLVAHNAAFDLLALNLAAEGSELQFDMPVLDTLALSRALDPTLEAHGLDALADRFQIQFPPGTRHTALGDARVTAELVLALIPRLESRGVMNLGDALEFQKQGALS